MTSQPDSAQGAAFSIASDPLTDRLIHLTPSHAVVGRLLYARGYEAHARSLPGQDYALLASAPDGHTLAFCVADGVGSSYYGGFAAAYLAQRLVPWLQALPGVPMKHAETHAALTAALDDWAAAAQRALPPLPALAEGGALVREVLQDLREAYGSETVFLAGRLDLDHRAPGHDSPPALLLCWMGNVRATLHRRASSRALVVAADGDEARWSTGRRLRGTLRMASYRLEAHDRLIVQTDGADSLGALIPTLGDEELWRRATALRALPASDDLTILDLTWAPDASAGPPRSEEAPRG